MIDNGTNKIRQGYLPQWLWNRYFVYAWFVAFFLQIGQNLYNSSISLYVDSMGMSATFAGSIAIPYAIMAIIARVLSGFITDNIGRRMGMMLGCATFFIGSLLFGLPALAFPVAMLLTRSLHGFGYASASTAYSTAVVDVTPPAKLSVGLGINWTAQGISQGVAGFVIILLIWGDNFIPLFAFATVVLGCGLLFSVLCSYEKKQAGTQESLKSGRNKRITLESLFERKAVPYALVLLVFYSGVALVMLFVLSFAAQQGYQNSSLFFVLYAAGMAVSNITTVRLADRFGAARVVVPVYLVAAVVVWLMGNIGNFLFFLVSGLLIGISIGVMPVIQNEMVQRLPPSKKGAGNSTLFLTMDIAMGVGPIIWGAVIDYGGYRMAFNLSAGVIFLAVVVAFVAFRRKDNALIPKS